MNSAQRLIRSQIALAVRLRPDDQETIERLRLELKVSKTESNIRALLEATPLAPDVDQRARLASLLLADHQLAS
jgi:hypothetical protein